MDAFTLGEMGDVDVVYGYDGHPNAGRDGAHGDFLKRCLLARRIILMTSASKEVVKNLGLPQEVQNEYDHHGLQNCRYGSSKVTIHLWVPKDYQPADGSTESTSFLAKMRKSSQYETPRPHPGGTPYYLNGLWDVYVAEDLPGEFNPTMRTYFVNKVTRWPETRLKLKKNTTYSEGVMYGWALFLEAKGEVRLLVIHSNHAVSLIRPGAYTTQTKAPKHGNNVLDDEQVKALLVQPMHVPSRTSSRLASIARASAKVTVELEDEDDSAENTNATTSAEEDEIDKHAKVATRNRTKVLKATKAATTTKHEKAKGGQPTQKQSTTKAVKAAEADLCKTRSCTKKVSRGSRHGCCADHGCSEPDCTRKRFTNAEGCTTCKTHTCSNPQCYKKRKGEGPRCGEHTCKLKGCSNPSPSSLTFCRMHVCSEPTCNKAKQTNSSQCRKHAFPRTALPKVKDVPVAPSSVTCTASQCNKKPRGGPRCAEHTCKLKGCSNASHSFACCEKHACSEPGCNSEKHAKSSLCKKHHFSETKKALLKELPKVGSGGIDHLQLGEPSLTRIFGHIDEATTKGMHNTNQAVDTARTASEKTAQSVLSHLSKKTKPALDEINDRTQNLPRVLEEIKSIAANSITQGSGNHDDIRGQIETARQEAKSANEEMMQLLEKATEQNSPGMTVGDHINLRQGESDMLVNLLKQGVAPLMDSFAATHRESIRSVASVARARVEKRSRSRSRSTRHKRSTRSPNRRCHRTHSRNRYRYYSRSRSRSRHHSRSRSRSHRGHRGNPSRHDSHSRSRSRSSSFGRSRSRSHGRRREDRRRRPRGRRRQ